MDAPIVNKDPVLSNGLRTDSPTVLWEGSHVAVVVQGQGSKHWQASGVSIDTRTLNPGDLFIALRGPHFDGHHFLEAALNKGAAASLVQDATLLEAYPHHPMLVVPDTFEALRQLGRAARRRFQGRILALTGSVGKTTVKDGLKYVLSQQSPTYASWQSLNNHLGVPLSLSRLPEDARYAIFEVGMNHAGEIAELVPLIAPHAALITQVSYQHGQFFDTLEDIVRAKAEIFSAPAPTDHPTLREPSFSYKDCPLSEKAPALQISLTSRDPSFLQKSTPEEEGIFMASSPFTPMSLSTESSALPEVSALAKTSFASHILASTTSSPLLETHPIKKQRANFLGILPRDSIHYRALREGGEGVTQWITFGSHPEATLCLVAQKPEGMGRRVDILVDKQPLSYHWPLGGDHTLDNSLAILAGAYALGADMSQVMRDIQNLRPSPGRGNLRILGGIHIIDDSYNAAPASMTAALKTFAQQSWPQKRYIVLGEMRELGAQSHECHENLIPLLQKCEVAGIWLCGAAFLPFLPHIPLLKGYAPDITTLIPSILETLKEGDGLLLKGAHSTRTFAVLEALESKFPHPK